ncbi:hypothetical protein D3C81_1863330 [compost metagenome]
MIITFNIPAPINAGINGIKLPEIPSITAPNPNFFLVSKFSSIAFSADIPAFKQTNL